MRIPGTTRLIPGKTALRAIWLAGLAVVPACYAAGGPALVVQDGTAGIEASALTNLTTHLTTAGYTVTNNVGVPTGSLATYKQIWDIRYNTTTPLSASDITAYVAYMAGGGSLFVMGENTGFATRNNSIISLVQSAGGGTITAITANDNETVRAPFTGPNGVTSMAYLAAAGAPYPPGNGTFITVDSNMVGAALVFAPGKMTGAAAGSLIIVFDVNFLDPGSGGSANSQAFTDNLIAYLAAPAAVQPYSPPATVYPSTSVPTLSEWAMILLTGGLALVAALKLRFSAVAHRE